MRVSIKKNQRAKMLQASRNSSLIGTTPSDTNPYRFLLTDEYGMVSTVATIVDDLKTLMPSKAELFVLDRRQRGLIPTNFGRQLLALCKCIDEAEEIRRSFPMHSFHPFFEVLAQERNKLLALPHSRFRNVEDAQVYLLELNKCTKALSDKLTQAGKQEKNHIRSANKNSANLRKYLLSVFQHYSCVWIARLDLGYDFNVEYPSLDQVIAHKKLFIKNMKTLWTELDCVGYAWRLEHSLKKGFRFHFVFLFRQITNEAVVATIVGDCWCKTVSGDAKGLYIDGAKYPLGNAKKNALGWLQNGEPRMLNELEDLVTYMTGDFYMKLVLPNNLRSFGKGAQPKVLG